MLEKIRELRWRHLKGFHDLVFYPYQELVSDRIIEAVIQNLRLTANATEEEIKKLELIEQAYEFSRQCGKTTAVVHTVEIMMIYFPRLFNLTGMNRLELEIFAPQSEQAKTDFDRLKEALLRSNEMVKEVGTEEEKIYKEQNNAKTLVLPNGASCYIAPVTQVSNPESKSPRLMIFEESQELDDQIVKQKVWPMGAARNAPRIYIGTAGTRLCHFYRLGQGSKALKLYFNHVVPERRKTYELTGDARHLIYEQTVAQEIELSGEESDEIQRPYFGKWLIGTGQFTTAEELDNLYDDDRGLLSVYRNTKTPLGESYAGIDTAKNPDSTVVTVLRWNKTRNLKEIIAWMELKGDNYQDQFDIIIDFLKKYDPVAVAIDSTAQGDFMPDLFEKHTQWQDDNSGLYRIKFSAVSKDLIYKNLKVSIKQRLTRLPKMDKRYGERFRQQMLDLQQEYKGQLLSVSHPDSPNAHDDYCDSLALAEWAYAKWNETKSSITSIEVSQKPERQVQRDHQGAIDSDWPSAFDG